ncbi:MAG: flagellar basal body-associated FliL family protein [Ignavibacteriaceae bacterium]|nr:flagellar basal body-associated FliL family protein [Ignavibacteriaceae bacterium]
MANEENKLEELTNSEIPIPKKKKGLNMKVLIIGLPLFIVQLVAVYFITATFLLNKSHGSENGAQNEVGDSTGVATDTVKKPEVELGRFIYSVEDIIVNPAQTDGKRILLATVGFDLNSEEQKTDLKNKEVLVKDIIISTLSSKTLPQLNDSEYKDTLKIEISKKVMGYIPKLKLNNIYFSKYIIQ